MAIEHANSFVRKVFEDDEFLKTVVRKRGFSRNESNKEAAENEKMVKVANDMGFHFDEEEYIKANQEYMNSLTGWEAARKVFHMVKVAAYVSREN
ncbi:MAG: Nif11-like leader peptide family natural product precursor [Clostridia bacterium]|nr:Nif11-like leader peptide family natural product precursor [Clostridia bacterium]